MEPGAGLGDGEAHYLIMTVMLLINRTLCSEKLTPILVLVVMEETQMPPKMSSLPAREMFLNLENESYVSIDTDIDPMHAGLDQWNSDAQDDEDGEWEEANWVEANRFVDTHREFQDVNISPFGNGMGGAQDSAWFQWRGGETQEHYADIFADLEELESRPAYVGNPGDYSDARGFEELLEQLAENGGSRRGAPPAAASSVRILPSVIISKEHEKMVLRFVQFARIRYLLIQKQSSFPVCTYIILPASCHG